MAWLIPSIMATMAGTAILTFCYYYLFLQDRKKYLKIWSISWAIYFVRYAFMLALLLWVESPFFLIGNQVSSLVSGVLLLYGSYLFIGKKFPRFFLYFSVVDALWIIFSILSKLPFLAMSLPTFSFLAFIYIWTGYIFYNRSKSAEKESAIVGIAFIIWGIHKADYPFLRPIAWFAPWGYLFGAILEFITALGLLLVYFRKTKNELLENQKRLMNAQTIAKVGDWVWDPATNRLTCSDETYRIFGRDPETFNLTIKTIEDAVHPEDYKWVMAQKDSAIKQNNNMELDCRIILPNDEIKYVQSIASTERNKDGNVTKIIGTFQDITERKQAELKLKEMSHLLMKLTEGTTDAIFIKDLNGRYILANSATCNAIGKNHHDIIGRTDKEFFPEASREVINSIDSQVIQSGEPLIAEENLTTTEGDTVWLTNKSPYLDENGKTIGIIGISRNITKLKKIEQEKQQLEYQLSQSQRIESIGTLAGGIAHDFNNILSSIIGFTELALDEVPRGSSLDSSLQEVYSAGKRAKDLVKQILAFARQSDEKRSPTQPGMVAKEVLKLLRSIIPTTIEIKQKIDSDSWVIGSPTQIHQVLMNLCTNAVHAMEDSGGVLTVSAKDLTFDGKNIPMGLRPGNYIEIQVSDTGVGISPEIIESIFEPYFTTKGPGEGTGMGLAVVHGIIESYGGNITVNSQVGKGTTFTIHLPTTKKKLDHEAYRPEQFPTGTERILVVDDEASIAKMDSRILEQLGYRVTAQTSSTEALELFRSNPNDFDLVITDMTMPEMTGDKLAVELMSIRRDIPVILCTGYSNKMSDNIAATIGIKAFAYKPISKADLAKTVRKVLDEAKI